MDGATVGWIGGIVGAAIGLAGGIVGTRASLKRTRTSAERRLVVRLAVGVWLAVVALGVVLALTMTGVLPYWVYLVVMCVFFVALGPAIALGNRRQRHIESSSRAAQAAPDRRQP